MFLVKISLLILIINQVMAAVKQNHRFYCGGHAFVFQ